MHIGLIGGIGVAATIVYYERLTALVAAQGAEAIVLAGTDLNPAFDGQSPGYEVIDALDVHVALLADLALNRTSLADVTG